MFDSMDPGLMGDEIAITYVTSDRFVCLHLILLLLQVQAVSTTSWVS